MKQSRLFTSVLISFLAIILFDVSHLSAAVTSWNDFVSLRSSYYDSLGRWGGNSKDPTSNLDEFNTYKIIRTTGSVQLLRNPDEIHERHLFHDIFVSRTFLAVPDELLTLEMSSQTSPSAQPSERNSNMRPTCEPADDIVFNNDADYDKSMPTPTPSSLLLVAVGLLSLRLTRILRY